MRLRHWLLPVSLAVSLPVQAQPPAGHNAGPWAADANADGRITRDEMTAYMDRRFGLMDQDSDGLVPVQAMQRMLGHERQARRQGDDDRKPGGPGKGRGEAGRPGGPGGSGGPPGGGAGGPPPGGPPPRDRRAVGATPPPLPPGRGMPYPEDGNDDGQIDRAEFLSPALAMFADQDRNGDGVLTADELPPPPGRGPGPHDPED